MGHVKHGWQIQEISLVGRIVEFFRQKWSSMVMDLKFTGWPVNKLRSGVQSCIK